MPELPEIEIIKCAIKKILVGNKILYLIIRNDNLRNRISKKIYSIFDKTVFDVIRLSKYILVKLFDGWIVIHLGISGNIRIFSKKNSLFPKKHDHIDVIISNGMIIRYNDPRRLGSWLWINNLEELPILKKLGPDPLSEDFNIDYLIKFCEKKTIIKSLLMNYRIIPGIGNIYSNESLFDAKIHPCRSISSLTRKEVELLVSSIKTLLYQSIKLGGTTLKNYTQPNGLPGLFKYELKVYGRQNKPCKICGVPISKINHAQRSTFYCSNCQN